MTNHYWDRVSAPHADRDRSEPADRDADNAPSVEDHIDDSDICDDCGERHAGPCEPTEHEHRWTRRQNVTSRGYRMPPYDVCECGAARPVEEWA